MTVVDMVPGFIEQLLSRSAFKGVLTLSTEEWTARFEDVAFPRKTVKPVASGADIQAMEGYEN